ncbi:hypothetical protein GCM10011575_35820 [Microlunatus endophyticus]|uniref:Uncharacterized protein n=1 Tax=Microlunatus endophyticus TaxID=1716077 RepID=A0A917W667_9ACTN|nr:hypothetical protein GCM10011575_35820 [Microlunatus endophyticus]
MHWFFDGLGTLIVGIIVGGAGGGAAGYRIAARRYHQRQSAGDNANQMQVGRDYVGRDRLRGANKAEPDDPTPK